MNSTDHNEARKSGAGKIRPYPGTPSTLRTRQLFLGGGVWWGLLLFAIFLYGVGGNVPGAMAQRGVDPTLVIGEAAVGGKIRLAAYATEPETVFRPQLRAGGVVIPFPDVVLVSDDFGGIGATNLPLPPGAAPGAYQLELIQDRSQELEAALPMTIHPGPTIALSASQALPGTQISVTVENLLPGTVQINLGGYGVVGPVTISGTRYSGVFAAPTLGALRSSEITAWNRQGGRLLGRGQQAFELLAGPDFGSLRVTRLNLMDPTIESGRTITLQGQISHVPEDTRLVSIAPLWQTGTGKPIPIGLGQAKIETDGTFEVMARVPSLLEGDAVFVDPQASVGVAVAIGNLAQTELLVRVDDLLTFGPRFGVLPVKLMPGSPQDGEPIPNLPVTGPNDPDSLQVEIEPLGTFSTILGESVDMNGILPLLDANDVMFELQKQQTFEFLASYVPTCIMEIDIASDYKRWEWVMNPHETVILSMFDQVSNPFSILSKVNSVNQFNALQVMENSGESDGLSGVAHTESVGGIAGAGSTDDEEGDRVEVQVFRVMADALRVVDGNQEGYGFISEFGFAEPYEGLFAYLPGQNLVFEIRALGDSFENWEAVPTENPAPLRMPPLPQGWQSSFDIHTVTLPGRSYTLNSNFGVVTLPQNMEFGEYRTLRKPGFGGNGINPQIQVLSTGEMQVEVRLVRYGTSVTLPDVSMSYRGTPLAVQRIEVPDDTPAKKCAKQQPQTNPLNIYRWVAQIPEPHIQPGGSHPLVIRAEEGGTVIQRTAQVKFNTYPEWFDGGNLSARTAEWSALVLRLKANPQPVSTNVQANVPKVGNQNSSVAMGQQEIVCNLMVGGGSDFQQSGNMSSVALNNNAAPLGYSGSSTCGANQLPQIAAIAWDSGDDLLIAGGPVNPIATPPGLGVTASAFDEGFLPASMGLQVANVQKTQLLDTGEIRVFETGFGIPGIAWIGLSVDFRIYASAAINTTIPSSVQTLFEGAVEVSGTISVSVLLGLASGSGQFISSIGVQIPTIFRLDGQVIEPDKCFFYGLDVRVRVKVFWQTVYNEIHNIFRGSTPGNCFQSWATAAGQLLGDLLPAQAGEIPEVPNAGPALATDGLGQTLLLWATEDDEILYSLLIGGEWSAPLPVAPGARGGDPAVAFYAPGSAVAVWSQSGLSEEPVPGTMLQDVLRSQHLVYAVWNGSEWSAVANLTEPTTGDGMASVAGCMSTDAACPPGGRATAVWVHDAVGDFTQRAFRLHTATFNGVGWTPVAPVDENLGESIPIDAIPDYADTEPTAVYRQGVPAVLWVRDADRNFETFEDRKLAFRFLQTGQSTVILQDLPGGVLEPSLAVDGAGNFQAAMTVVAQDDLPLGNRRVLYRAKGTCMGQDCSWGAAQITDGLGRILYAELPVVMVVPLEDGDEVSIVYRAMGTNPTSVPGGPFFSQPEPLGVVNRTGELAQLDLSTALVGGPVTPSYLTQDGAVNWQPAALYEPVLNSVLALAVQDPSLSLAQNGGHGVGVNRAQLVPGSDSLVLATVAHELPNFVIADATFGEGDLGNGPTVPVRVLFRNTGASWSHSEGEPPLTVAARWGSLAAPAAGELTINALGRNQTLEVNFDMPAPIQRNMSIPLYLTVNPRQAILEQTSVDNVYSVVYPGLPAPRNVYAESVEGYPTIWLKWEASTDPRVVGYRIYRLGPGATRTPVGTSLTEGWMDLASTWDEDVQYAVVAYGDDLTESEPTFVNGRSGMPPEIELPEPGPTPVQIYLPSTVRD